MSKFLRGRRWSSNLERRRIFAEATAAFKRARDAGDDGWEEAKAWWIAGTVSHRCGGQSFGKRGRLSPSSAGVPGTAADDGGDVPPPSVASRCAEASSALVVANTNAALVSFGDEVAEKRRQEEL